jgi:hypothetical protein
MFYPTIAYLISHLTVLVPGDVIGDKLNALAGTVQTDARLVGGTVFFISVIIAGIMRMVAFGSERRIALSNMALTAAVVGLIIMLLATVLYQALHTVLGG